MSNGSKPPESQLKVVKQDEEHEPEMSRVKELLFGEELRTVESHFADLEARLQKATDAMMGSITKRLELVETFARKELDSLSDRIKAERTDRKTALTEVSGGIERLEHDQEELRRDVLTHVSRLTEEFEDGIHAAIQSAEKSMGMLNLAKADRKHLAKILNNAADELLQDEAPRKDIRKAA